MNLFFYFKLELLKVIKISMKICIIIYTEGLFGFSHLLYEKKIMKLPVVHSGK